MLPYDLRWSKRLHACRHDSPACMHLFNMSRVGACWRLGTSTEALDPGCGCMHARMSDCGCMHACTDSRACMHAHVSGCMRACACRHDLKIYSSDEGRVQTSAAAFTQGLLDLEGDSLTPILVRCSCHRLPPSKLLIRGCSAHKLLLQPPLHALASVWLQLQRRFSDHACGSAPDIS